MKKGFLGFLALIALLLTFAGSAKAESELDFTLVNKTGYDIKELYIGPTSSDDWGDNVLSKMFKDGASFELSFHPKATAAKWDIKVTYDDGDTAEWKGVQLAKINKITLFWSKEKGSSATAE